MASYRTGAVTSVGNRLRRAAVLVSMVALSLVTVSAVGAASEGNKLIQIDSKEVGFPSGEGHFVFSLGTGGDFGKLTFKRCCYHERESPEGLHYTLYSQTTTLRGRTGTLVIRSVSRAYEMGIGPAEVWEGTWSVVTGSDAFAGIRGGGRWIGIATHVDHSVTSRYSGYVRP